MAVGCNGLGSDPYVFLPNTTCYILSLACINTHDTETEMNTSVKIALFRLSIIYGYELCNTLIFYVTSQLQDAMEYAECEATVKDFLPFMEAMRKRGIEDMDLVMVDAW